MTTAVAAKPGRRRRPRTAARPSGAKPDNAPSPDPSLPNDGEAYACGDTRTRSAVHATSNSARTAIPMRRGHTGLAPVVLERALHLGGVSSAKRRGECAEQQAVDAADC